ncbi:MAG: DUF262 domain-containing protein [bacterium]|nr:DUF262 domain-containing protein [bacterium]
MDAKTYPLQEILKPERRYIIPTFQRDYEWTLDGQWKLLFEDLENTAERLLEVRLSGATESSLTSREQSISPHFLGAIVCAGLPFPTGGIALRSVIDGQQRLTTVLLMIRGLLDVLQEEEADRAKSVRRMLFNPDDVVEGQEEVYKLWPRRKDREVWPSALDDEPPAENRASEHRYLEARKFFANSAREFALDGNGKLEVSRLVALSDAISSLFKLVVIDLDDNDDAQVIFEVLNGRQTPLSAIDLVKNLLFLRSEFNDEDVEVLYDKYWAQFDDDWWKKEVGRGHAQRGHRDVLLSVWLTAAIGKEASVGHLYREVRGYLEDGPETETILQELNIFAEAYRVMYNAASCEDERLAVSYGRVRSLEIMTAVPLLTWLRTVSPTQLHLEDHVRAVRAIESWALRRVFVGWQTRGYGTHFSRVLSEAKQAAEKNVDIAEAVITGLQGGSLGWPTDADIRRAFQERKYYRGISQARIRLLLGSIDERLRNEDPNEPSASIEYHNLQIEHVMPQRWQDHWPLMHEDGSAVEKDTSDPRWLSLSDVRDRVVDRIGNLTLVTSSFNGSVSHLGWTFKKQEFEKQKSLVINYGLAQSESWDEDSISERADALATVAISIWPSAEELSNTSAFSSTIESQ